MINITDNDGKMLPAVRNLFTLVFCAVFFVAGWVGHANWSIRGEADQLIKDAKTAAKAREVKTERIGVLDENIERALHIPQTTGCNCGDTTDIEFMRELRKTREKRSIFDGTDPFPVYKN